ncbi:MAG: DUF2249 domain-containing protein [Longimicrobiales bacterium]
MVIRHDDRVSTVIGRDESLVDVFVALSPAFERLRSSAMRKVMARLVTVEQAARMAGIDAGELVNRLNAHVAGTGPKPDAAVVGRADDEGPASGPGGDAHMPSALRSITPELHVELDVREELRAGHEPFSLIMAARRDVPPGGALAVRAIFEPVPLYAVMRRQGLAHFTEQLGAEDWRVWFFADDADPAQPESSAVPARDDADTGADPDVAVLDVRGLEPPEPMVRTLAALETLPSGGTLVQINVRVPQFLLPLLEERGFTYDVREQAADLVRVFIRHRTAASVVDQP